MKRRQFISRTTQASLGLAAASALPAMMLRKSEASPAADPANAPSPADSWLQLKYDSRRSGNAQGHSLKTPLELLWAAPLSDAIFTSPVAKDGRVYAVDGAGVAWCLDAITGQVKWRHATAGGPMNCNNVSSPAIVGSTLHFGTMAGDYVVLNLADGAVIATLPCGEPIFSSPVVTETGVYFATLGSRIYSVTAEGKVRWMWDFVKEHLKFDGDRWDGQAWAAARGRVTWKDQFCCSRDMAAQGDRLVVPAGGMLVWIRDAGEKPEILNIYLQPEREAPATLGLSIGEDGTVYRQWYRRDNYGRVEVLKFDGTKVHQSSVPGTTSWWSGSASMSFSSVAIRGRTVYRTRPEEGFGFCRHDPEAKNEKPLLGYPSIAPPVLAGRHAVFGGLDGKLYVTPIDGGDQVVYATPHGKPISGAAAVFGGYICFGGEDGYLYLLSSHVLKPFHNTPKLDMERIRSPLTGPNTEPAFDWFTNFGDLANTNSAQLGQVDAVAPPFKMRWIRRYEGTVKHMSVFGGGRMFTHTAEGQIFAVEQETGRLLWRRFFPGVHISHTAPILMDGMLLVPQAGLDKSFVRCLDPATGQVKWEAPFTGSPSWNRQLPPIVHNGLVIYQYSTGKYDPKNWLFEHQNTFEFPKNHKPIITAWDAKTGKAVWTIDFSQYGSGGDDAGMCLMDGVLYYSCYFGNKTRPHGITAAIEPTTGRVLWKNLDQAVHAGCTVSGQDGLLYLGGYNPVEEGKNVVWCLNARDGSLAWKSDPVDGAIHVITIARDFLFTHAQYKQSYILDKKTGKVLRQLGKGYRCTRFTLCGRYLLGANLDVYDTSEGDKLVSSGPAIDVLLCVGAQVSNGRIFYTANGSGLQAGLSCGEDARKFKPVWRRD